MDNIDQILEKNYEQLDILKSELTNLKEIKNRIEVLIGSNDKLPIIFSELFDKINKVTNDFTNVLGNSVNVFLEGNNDLLVKNNTEFSSKINELGSEISRLVEVDFNVAFKELESKFLENSKEEIGKELKKIDAKVNFFQTKINDLEDVIFKLAAIDLEEHFNRHQSKLSEVFISVNGINGILTTISQNINKIIQNFGDIEQTLSKNQKEIDENFNIVNKNQENNKKELVDILEINQQKLLSKVEESDAKINSIISQNELLKKEIHFNKKLSFAMIALLVVSVVVALIY